MKPSDPQSNVRPNAASEPSSKDLYARAYGDGVEWSDAIKVWNIHYSYIDPTVLPLRTTHLPPGAIYRHH